MLVFDKFPNSLYTEYSEALKNLTLTTHEYIKYIYCIQKQRCQLNPILQLSLEKKKAN